MQDLALSEDVIVIGAGAAGLMCAFEAGRRGRRVLLLDHADRPGRKVLISGGGRCNFTNTGTGPENFISGNPHFSRSALARFTPADMITLVQKHNIGYHEKTLGQLFCDDSARRVVELLERECGDAGVEIRLGVRVSAVHPAEASTAADAPRFIVETGSGAFTCSTLVVATGGLSIPKMGATGLGYDIARTFGHTVLEPRPALVPLTLASEDLEDWVDLAGVSTEVVIGAELPMRRSKTLPAAPEPRRRQPGKLAPTPSFREKLLITHRGLSGPAVLQISSYWHPGAALTLDLAPGTAVFPALKASTAGRDARAMLSAAKRVLPARLAERWVELRLRNAEDWSNAGIDRSEEALHSWRLQPAGTEGFAKAEVTAGGVDTTELDSRTLESRRTPGLHFIGEVVDVTGWLGGYNFQWAWASAVACGRSL